MFFLYSAYWRMSFSINSCNSVFCLDFMPYMYYILRYEMYFCWLYFCLVVFLFEYIFAVMYPCNFVICILLEVLYFYYLYPYIHLSISPFWLGCIRCANEYVDKNCIHCAIEYNWHRLYSITQTIQLIQPLDNRRLIINDKKKRKYKVPS